MRILICGLNFSGGLAEAFAAREGVSVSCLHASRADLGDFGVSVPRPPADAPYTLYTRPVFPPRPYPYSLYRGGLRALLREVRPDVIYQLGEPSELNTAQLARAARHACPDARLVLFSYENLVRTWRGFPRCLRGAAERYVISRLDGAAACTQDAAAALQAAGLPPERVRVVPHGLSPAGFTHAPDAALRGELAPADAFLVGYVGRLVPEKGVDLLLQALAHLPSRFCLAVVGSGREQAALADLAARLSVTDRVRWVGRVPNARMGAFLSTLDALVLPSRSIPQWQEQYGAVLVEAMFCETAVVGSSSGAIPEVIGDAGLIFPESDATALAAALQRLADEPELRDALAAAGRARALREFHVDAYVDRLLTLFRELLQRG